MGRKTGRVKPVMKQAAVWLCAASLLGMSLGLLPPAPASAITVEVAKKCRALADKAYPPVLPGMKKGNAANERAYFSECVSKGGDMPEPAPAAQPGPSKASK